MTMTDPIADLLTRIRNAQSAGKVKVTVPASKAKMAILDVLQAEGYIAGYERSEVEHKALLEVVLKYHQRAPVIETLQRISKPGLRVYCGKDELPVVNGGLGTAIISTSRGVMSDKQARQAGHGGEVICTVT